MSDYLARAAERAGPVDLSIRPRLQSRYEGSAAPVGMMEEERETANAAVAPRVAETHQAGASSTDWESSQPLASETPPVESRRPQPPQEQDTPRPHPVDVRTIPLLQERVVVRRESLETWSTAAPPLNSKTEPGNRPSSAPVPSSTSSKPAETYPIRPITPIPPPVSTSQSQPLLELPRSPLPGAILPIETTPAPPAVNITIGRLEIRAAPVAEKPKPQPQPTGRGPLALDEFLRGKSPRAPSRA